MELCWNVYCDDCNGREIKLFNVFNHRSFYNSCVKAKKKYKDDKEAFAKDVKGWLMYYFWSKCEWEIILAPWPSGELYEMRKTMKIEDLRNAIDISCNEWRNYDSAVEVRCYVPNSDKNEKKIDVYDQVINNWDHFIDYLWENRKLLKEKK